MCMYDGKSYGIHVFIMHGTSSIKTDNIPRFERWHKQKPTHFRPLQKANLRLRTMAFRALHSAMLHLHTLFSVTTAKRDGCTNGGVALFHTALLYFISPIPHLRLFYPLPTHHPVFMDFGIQCLYRPQNCPAVMLELGPTHLCVASSSSTAQLNNG